jgi:hypothetical protein
MESRDERLGRGEGGTGWGRGGGGASRVSRVLGVVARRTRVRCRVRAARTVSLATGRRGLSETMTSAHRRQRSSESCLRESRNGNRDCRDRRVHERLRCSLPSCRHSRRSHARTVGHGRHARGIRPVRGDAVARHRDRPLRGTRPDSRTRGRPETPRGGSRVRDFREGCLRDKRAHATSVDEHRGHGGRTGERRRRRDHARCARARGQSVGLDTPHEDRRRGWSRARLRRRIRRGARLGFVRLRRRGVRRHARDSPRGGAAAPRPARGGHRARALERPRPGVEHLPPGAGGARAARGVDRRASREVRHKRVQPDSVRVSRLV